MFVAWSRFRVPLFSRGTAVPFERLNYDLVNAENNEVVLESNNSDDIIINVWLTSPERKIFYYNSNPFMLSPWMIMNNILPHQTNALHWEEMKEDVSKFTELWVEFFHNQKFFITIFMGLIDKFFGYFICFD